MNDGESSESEDGEMSESEDGDAMSLMTHEESVDPQSPREPSAASGQLSESTTAEIPPAPLPERSPADDFEIEANEYHRRQVEKIRVLEYMRLNSLAQSGVLQAKLNDEIQKNAGLAYQITELTEGMKKLEDELDEVVELRDAVKRLGKSVVLNMISVLFSASAKT
ncbi:uncharacterized protein DSM5745_00738 [Aspergillus mulundensis]|uniref:Uncharacterized protein n=1 Tax=Aspergillus mulundensis TaxID=1810919 RepID=A0A3D8T4D2_9EURO|nr:hypothetical protein DSM5745_00738 [Aspergillus mulundensis]RDW93416.1 hypothetical protein DSM5745_00738 [Aspergillus mulundensis]